MECFAQPCAHLSTRRLLRAVEPKDCTPVRRAMAGSSKTKTCGTAPLSEACRWSCIRHVADPRGAALNQETLNHQGGVLLKPAASWQIPPPAPPPRPVTPARAHA